MLLIDVWHPPIWVSLTVIVGVLGATALLSLGATRSRRETAEAHEDEVQPADPDRREAEDAEPVGAGRHD